MAMGFEGLHQSCDPSGEIVEPIQQIGPTGKSPQNLSIPICKNILLFRNANQAYIFSHPVSPWGAFRDRHRREAGMRWTRRVRRTSALEADGQVVWCWLPDAGVKFLGSESFSGMTVAKKPGRRGEHDISRKPVRGECRVIPV